MCQTGDLPCLPGGLAGSVAGELAYDQAGDPSAGVIVAYSW